MIETSNERFFNLKVFLFIGVQTLFLAGCSAKPGLNKALDLLKEKTQVKVHNEVFILDDSESPQRLQVEIKKTLHKEDKTSVELKLIREKNGICEQAEISYSGLRSSKKNLIEQQDLVSSNIGEDPYLKDFYTVNGEFEFDGLGQSLTGSELVQIEGYSLLKPLVWNKVMCAEGEINIKPNRISKKELDRFVNEEIHLGLGVPSLERELKFSGTELTCKALNMGSKSLEVVFNKPVEVIYDILSGQFVGVGIVPNIIHNRGYYKSTLDMSVSSFVQQLDKPVFVPTFFGSEDLKLHKQKNEVFKKTIEKLDALNLDYSEVAPLAIDKAINQLGRETIKEMSYDCGI